MIAIGAKDSGTAALAMTLLEATGIAKPPTTIMKLGGRAAANLLLAGGSTRRSSSATRARRSSRSSYTRRAYACSASLAPTPIAPALLPDQVRPAAGRVRLDAQHPRPGRGAAGTTANLVVKDDLHPALAYLLLRAAARCTAPHHVLGPAAVPGAQRYGAAAQPRGRSLLQVRPAAAAALPALLGCQSRRPPAGAAAPSAGGPDPGMHGCSAALPLARCAPVSIAGTPGSRRSSWSWRSTAPRRSSNASSSGWIRWTSRPSDRHAAGVLGESVHLPQHIDSCASASSWPIRPR